MLAEMELSMDPVVPIVFIDLSDMVTFPVSVFLPLFEIGVLLPLFEIENSISSKVSSSTPPYFPKIIVRSLSVTPKSISKSAASRVGSSIFVSRLVSMRELNLAFPSIED